MFISIRNLFVFSFFLITSVNYGNDSYLVAETVDHNQPKVMSNFKFVTENYSRRPGFGPKLEKKYEIDSLTEIIGRPYFSNRESDVQPMKVGFATARLLKVTGVRYESFHSDSLLEPLEKLIEQEREANRQRLLKEQEAASAIAVRELLREDRGLRPRLAKRRRIS